MKWRYLLFLISLFCSFHGFAQKAKRIEMKKTKYFSHKALLYDTDGDGVPDLEDECPKDRGVVTANGCPDADSDGVSDDLDYCPNLYAKTINGCPEGEIHSAKNDVDKNTKESVKQASKQIQFNSGSDYFIPSAYPALRAITSILLKDTSLFIVIEGHTDNVGEEDANISLSQRRADACKQYFISHGVSPKRMSSIGYGDMNPIDDNDTDSGRANNRRTEIILSHEEP
ncbi:MAG: OmpA family protein [Chitinophagaceae bacterium]|nr:MAG: OmpA/MotB domain-containing protein [Bacteroidetes bacterium OLB11]MCC6448467.1 OmpA family protein [Chitinophagaceae bacterium]HMN33702.1 OmpA family protein [Chitinophagaceae bacterium]